MTGGFVQRHSVRLHVDLDSESSTKVAAAWVEDAALDYVRRYPHQADNEERFSPARKDLIGNLRFCVEHMQDEKRREYLTSQYAEAYVNRTQDEAILQSQASANRSHDSTPLPRRVLSFGHNEQQSSADNSAKKHRMQGKNVTWKRVQGSSPQKTLGTAITKLGKKFTLVRSQRDVHTHTDIHYYMCEHKNCKGRIDETDAGFVIKSALHNGCNCGDQVRRTFDLEWTEMILEAIEECPTKTAKPITNMVIQRLAEKDKIDYRSIETEEKRIYTKVKSVLQKRYKEGTRGKGGKIYIMPLNNMNDLVKFKKRYRFTIPSEQPYIEDIWNRAKASQSSAPPFVKASITAWWLPPITSLIKPANRPVSREVSPVTMFMEPVEPVQMSQDTDKFSSRRKIVAVFHVIHPSSPDCLLGTLLSSLILVVETTRWAS